MVTAPRPPELRERLDNTLRDRVGFWGARAGPHDPWGSLPARDISESHTEQCRDPVLNTSPKTPLWQHPQSGKGPLDPSKSHKTPAPAPSGGAPGGCGGPDEAAFAALLNQVSGVSSGQRSRLAPALGAEHGNSEAGESSSGSALPREKDPAAPPILPAAPRRKGSFGGATGDSCTSPGRDQGGNFHREVGKQIQTTRSSTVAWFLWNL